MCSLLSRAVASPCAPVCHVTYAKDGAFKKTFLTKKSSNFPASFLGALKCRVCFYAVFEHVHQFWLFNKNYFQSFVFAMYTLFHMLL